MPKPKGPTEKQIHWAIVKLLRQMGYHVSSTAQSRPSRIAEGLPDLWVMGRGKAMWVEVKRGPKAKLRPAQQVFADGCQRNGVTYLVWRSVDDAVDWLRGEGFHLSAIVQ